MEVFTRGKIWENLNDPQQGIVKLLYIHVMGYEAALKIHVFQRHWGTENAHNLVLSGEKWKPRLCR